MPVSIGFIGSDMRNFLLVMATALLSACTPSYGPGFEFLDEDLDQNIRRPLIRGTAYDPVNERVFFSSCRPQEFACDLLAVESNQTGPAQELRVSREYGYTWPAVSPDGERLAVVRTPRRWRPNQTQVPQELVEISLASGEERVIASSEGTRFDRVLYVPLGILVVRTIRSTPEVPCYDYFCGDWGDLVIFRDGERERLPIEARSDSGIVGSSIDLTRLGEERILIRAPERPPSSRGSWWILNQDGRLRGPATSRAQMEALVAEVSLGGWQPEELLSSGARRIESRPFSGTTGASLALTNINMSDSRHGAFVRKVRTGAGFTLHVEAIERGDDAVWRSRWAIDTNFPR